MEPIAEAARAEKLYAETRKLMAETARINVQVVWLPIAVSTTLLLIAVAVVKFLL